MSSRYSFAPGRGWIFTMGLAMGIMASPETLVVSANGIGRIGWPYLVAVLVGAGVYLLFAGQYKAFYSTTGGGDEISALGQTYPRHVVFVLTIYGRCFFAVLAGTLILARAGYVFNEHFALWFPNLAFSFTLLGFLCLVNIAWPRVSVFLQAACLAVFLAGLIALIAAGWSNPAAWSIPRETAGSTGPAGWRTVLMAMFLFLGFETAYFRTQNDGVARAGTGVYFTIILFMSILGLWLSVSYLHVPAHRLARTTVPYASAARAIWVETGAMIVGWVVLAGCIMAVNALLIVSASVLKDWSRSRVLPRFFNLPESRPVVPMLIITAALAGMMADGQAGHDETVSRMWSAAYVWLAVYAMGLWSEGRLPAGRLKKDGRLRGLRFFVSLAAGLAAVLLFFTDRNLRDYIWFTPISLLVLFVVSVICSYFSSRRPDLNSGAAQDEHKP